MIAERLGKILRIVGKYSHIVGTAIQCDPQVGALVWAGVQGIPSTGLYLLLLIESPPIPTDSMRRSP